jgi:colicin import membrane protein
MVAVSLVLHAAALVLGVLWAGYRSPSPRFLSVTVVDLVGGPAFAPPARSPEKPAARPAPPPPAKAATEEPPAPAKKEKAPAAKEKAAPPESRPPDADSLSESLKRMREKQVSTDRLREAVVAIRREKAARSAIRQVGERVAHRIDLSAVRSPAKDASPAPPSGLAGAAGQARVSPENLAYFRMLDEKIRSNWTAPMERKDLMVQLRIVIEKNGQVSQVRMEKTSGNSFFDDSVLRAINKASPLPVPPEQLRGSEDHYEVGFRFWGAGGAL